MKLYRFLEPDETIAEGDVEDYYGDLEEVAEQDVGRDACDGLRGTGIWRLVAEVPDDANVTAALIAIDAIAVRYVRSLEEQLAAARTNPAGTMPINEFRDAGFIAAINHRLLHPVGLALGVTVHDDGTATLGPVYTTDDPEGWIYGLKDPDYAADIEQKLERVAAREAEWHPRRNAALSFVIQPITATATEDQP